jgi:hypothetical protein
MITSSLDSGAVSQISAQLGQDSDKTRSAIQSALPMLLGAVTRSAHEDNGAGLANALSAKHDGGLLDDVAGYLSKNDQSDGAGILGHVLGSKQDAAAATLQKAAGVDKDKASSLLATLAPIVLGALGKAKRDAGMSGADLTRALDTEALAIESKAPGMMGALTGMLDADGDGDTDLSDLLSKGSGLLGGLLR